MFILFVNLASFALFCKIFEPFDPPSTEGLLDRRYIYFWCTLVIIIFGFYIAYDISLIVDYERYQLDVGDFAIATIVQLNKFLYII